MKFYIDNIPITKSSEAFDGYIEGYGNIYGIVDTDGDVIVKGAFDDYLGREYPLRYEHSSRLEDIIGTFVPESDDLGLKIKGSLFVKSENKTNNAITVFNLLRTDALSGLSVGGSIERSEMRDGKRYITKASLNEVSIVKSPANRLSRTLIVKSVDGLSHQWRVIEDCLRDANYSKKESMKAISLIKSMKISGSVIDSDENNQMDELVDSIKILNRTIVEKIKG